MPLRKDIHKVMVLGSGPIVIGQAAEFDYAGTQACRALREEGLEVVLVNSNPATIMTDKAMADKVYIEPMTIPCVEEIIKKLEAGEDVDKQAYVDEEMFAADDTVTSIKVDDADYEVTTITQDIIDGRAY